jgi:hypothetical protein
MVRRRSTYTRGTRCSLPTLLLNRVPSDRQQQSPCRWQRRPFFVSCNFVAFLELPEAFLLATLRFSYLYHTETGHRRPETNNWAKLCRCCHGRKLLQEQPGQHAGGEANWISAIHFVDRMGQDAQYRPPHSLWQRCEPLCFCCKLEFFLRQSPCMQNASVNSVS